MDTANDTPSLADVEHLIAREIDDINLAISQCDLNELEGAADKLPKILELAKSLSNEINDLGNMEHSNRKTETSTLSLAGLFECLTRQSARVVAAADSEDKEYCGVGVANHIELLKGWLETINAKLGALEGNCAPFETPRPTMN